MKEIKLTMDNVTEELQKEIPEYFTSEFYHDFRAGLPYSTLGGLGSLLQFLIDGDGNRYPEEGYEKNKELIDRIFAFIQRMVDTGDAQLMNLAQVEPLEMMTDRKIYVDVTRSQLKGAALELFESIFTYFNFPTK